MSKNRKTSRNALLRQLRRRGLIAMLLACGAAGTVLADEGSPKSEINLKLLPPLPVEIGQISAVANGESAKTEITLRGRNQQLPGVSRLRNNPYVADPNDPAYGKTIPVPTQHSPEGFHRSGIRQVGIITTDAGKRTESNQGQPDSVRLVQQPASSFSLRPVALPNQRVESVSEQGFAVQATPAASSEDALNHLKEEADRTSISLPDVQQNTWVSAEEEGSNATGLKATAVSPSAHFSLSDRPVHHGVLGNESNTSDLDANYRLKDDQIIVSGAAPLLKAVPPTLLRVAAPMHFGEETSADTDSGSFSELEVCAEDMTPEAQHGDVRSATGKVSRASLTESQFNASADISNPVANDAGREIVVVDGIDGIDGASGILEVAEPAIILAEPSSPDVQTDEEVFIPKSELPVPQVYRPKQSLVIDVPVSRARTTARTSNLDASADDPAHTSTVASQNSVVIPVTVAQTQAFTPSDAMRRVQLENRDICEAVLVGSHKLLLIGRTEGVTRLAIWCGDDSEPQLFEVQVAIARDATPGSSLASIATRLSETIAATYPKCRVRVVPDGEGLAVIGTAGDAKSAREILRLVRSACLKSVNDQLEVR